MKSILVMLLACSVTMSALALFYMAVTPLLAKRYSAAGRYYAWLVVVIGLVIPFRPQLGGAIIKVGMPDHAAAPVVQIGNRPPVAILAPAASALPAAASAISWWQLAAAVWLAGVAVFLAYHVIKHRRFLKLAARWSETVTDGQTLAIFQGIKEQMGLSKPIGLLLCESIGSPMLIGFARPRILLPAQGFAEDELRFILKHELVHYQRKDLWYKLLTLIATAIHWFNPIVHLMANEIGRQCELSCDAQVVRSAGADTRLSYSETIIGVVRYKSKLSTALSTNFYGGKKGMKARIFSIMDTSKKKAGAAVLCGALLLTLGSGAAFAAGGQTQNPPVQPKADTEITPWISVEIFPEPETYAKYAAFGITISKDGTKLLYNGRPVRLFADEKSDTEAFYLDGAGSLNLSVIRNTAGEITGIERMTAQEAQKYYEHFFAEELDPDFMAKVNEEAARDLAKDTVMENVQVGSNKYEKYRPFGITYSAPDQVLYYHGQRVKFFIDQPASGNADALWADDAGTVNVAAVRDASGRVTGVESISDAKASEYQSAADQYEQNALIGLDERVEARLNARFADN